jgi:hypothetical protein
MHGGASDAGGPMKPTPATNLTAGDVGMIGEFE